MSSQDVEIEWEYYRYSPTLIGAIIFTVVFFATSALHAVQLYRTRTWYFIPFLVGGLMEAIGYIGRILSHYDQYTLGPYIMQTLLLLVAPALFAASIYMILGRLVRRLEGNHHSMVSLRWLTKIFVSGDILSFILQAAGGGIMSGGTLKMMQMGEHVVIGGLFVQIVFFSFFLGATIMFHYRIHKSPTTLSVALPRGGKTGWASLLKVLYAASSLILIRSIFRVAEYIQGNAGYLLRNEVWLYTFDSVLMLAVMLLFNFLHPSGVVPGRGRTTEMKDGVGGYGMELGDSSTIRDGGD